MVLFHVPVLRRHVHTFDACIAFPGLAAPLSFVILHIAHDLCEAGLEDSQYFAKVIRNAVEFCCVRLIALAYPLQWSSIT